MDNQAHVLRNKLIATRMQYHNSEATIEQLFAAADDYIAALKAYKKASGKRFTIPSRSYLIRAL